MTPVRELERRKPRTTVIVTHDPVVAASTDRVSHMQDGLVADAPPSATVA